MSFAHQTLTGSKPEQYAQLADQARALLAGEPDRIANAANLALDSLDLTKVGQNAEVWEKVILKLRAGLMPPAGR